MRVMLGVLAVTCACSFDRGGLPSPVAGSDRPGGWPELSIPIDAALLDRPANPQESRPVDQKPLPPDKLITPPDTRQCPGSPCPCQPPLGCFQNVCRTPCTRDGCSQSATCAASESCANTSAGYLCVPGVGDLASCSSSKGPYCAQGLLCTTVSGDPNGKCRKICDPATATCNCIDVSGMSCHICN
jgi:hypothetical protein